MREPNTHENIYVFGAAFNFDYFLQDGDTIASSVGSSSGDPSIATKTLSNDPTSGSGRTPAPETK